MRKVVRILPAIAVGLLYVTLPFGDAIALERSDGSTYKMKGGVKHYEDKKFSIARDICEHLQMNLRDKKFLGKLQNVSEEIQSEDIRICLGCTVIMGYFYVGNDITARSLRRNLEQRFSEDSCLKLVKRKNFSVICHECKGKGKIVVKCQRCGGSGTCKMCKGTGHLGSSLTDTGKERKCPACNGTGVCRKCKGTGEVAEICKKCHGKGLVVSKARIKQVYTELLANSMEKLFNAKELAEKDRMKSLAESERKRAIYLIAKQEWDECAKVGKPAVEPLIVALKDKDESVRYQAAEALGKIGDNRAVDSLIAALKDKNMSVVLGSIRALGKIGNRRAAEGLVDALGHESIEVQEQAAEVLGKIGKDAVEPLIAALKDENTSVVLRAIRVLGEIGGRHAAKGLVDALGHESIEVQEQAAEALGKIGKSAVNPLISVLRYKKKSDPIRLRAVEILAEIGEPAVELLITSLKDKDESVRHQVEEALVKIGKPAVEPLVAAMEGKNLGVRKVVAEALDKLGWEPANDREKAIYLMSKGKWDECAKVGKPAVELLITALKDKNESVRCQVVEALGKIGDKRAIEPIFAALGDKNPNIRKVAAEALNKLGWEPANDSEKAIYLMSKGEWDECAKVGKPAVELLITALKDKDGSVRCRAAETLGKIGDNRAVDPLIAALNTYNINVQIAVAEALGKIGDKRGVEPLIAALNNSDSRVRSAAAKALDELGWDAK